MARSHARPSMIVRRSSLSDLPEAVSPFFADEEATRPNAVRRASRVRFNDEESSSPADAGSLVSLAAGSPNSPRQPERTAQTGARAAAPDWHMPLYTEQGGDDNSGVPKSVEGDTANATSEEYVYHPVSRIPIGPYDVGRRRTSVDSDTTLYDEKRGQRDSEIDKKFSLSSYRHPFDISPPSNAYTGQPRQPAYRRTVSFADSTAHGRGEDIDEDPELGPIIPTARSRNPHSRRRGYLANLIDLYGLQRQESRPLDDEDHSGDQRHQSASLSRQPSAANSEYSVSHLVRGQLQRMPTTRMMSFGSQEALDEEDPRVTGYYIKSVDDPEDERRAALRTMTYRQRRKEMNRIRIEFNITSVVNRQHFLLTLAKALMTFGAPSHRVEAQLMAAARILEVDAEFIHLPNVIVCSFIDEETKTSQTHFVKCGGRLALGALHKLHLIYRSVVHDEISARRATEQLDELLASKPLYPIWLRCILSFCLSALICPLAFGGSFLDMWVAGAGAFILCLLQLGVAAKSALYANVFEITTAMLVSFTARGLSSIRSEIFCYTAISSASIIGILPGYLILSSSLELASKNIVCGSVKMVYALIYTLFLGFGLQIGSDLFLLFDPSARHELSTLAATLASTVTIQGSFSFDNATVAGVNSTLPMEGVFTFTNSTPVIEQYILNGCYRPPTFAWYLQPFPWWTQFVIVPIFSILSSLANLQPWRSKQLPVMVVISCASYAANKIANHYIFNRSDIVSAIGAFTVGVLGNVYSRKMGGTAFTSMVTGVLFLVPSGLSQTGGITGTGSGVDIGGSIIAVAIGITVGLFMSQALVYTFGSRKNAAVFSF